MQSVLAGAVTAYRNALQVVVRKQLGFQEELSRYEVHG
jgi:hypothetical protein